MLSTKFKSQRIGSIPLLLSKKKDKTLRLYLDPKELNQYILRDYKTIPTPEEISSKLHGKNIFAVIDMAD